MIVSRPLITVAEWLMIERIVAFQVENIFAM